MVRMTKSMVKSCGSKTTLGGTGFQGNVIHPTMPEQNLSTRNGFRPKNLRREKAVFIPDFRFQILDFEFQCHGKIYKKA